ncbi:MAG: MFS transporter, partial [Lentisphaeria bacterium]|nr:MFS transporter [Lentisphaeria bacterium]
MSTEKKVWTNGTLTYTTAGVVVLFCWLLWGDFAWGLKERAVGFVAGLMVKSYGISNFWYAILITAYPCFTNTFLMPAISFWSDRHRGRLGRRIPFLLFTTPFVVLGLAGLSVTPMLGEWLQGMIGVEKISLNMCRLIFFAISWAILDFGTTLTNAIFIALANDVVPTKLIGRFLAMFRMMSLCCAVIFNYWLMGYAETHATYIFAGLAVFYGVGLYSLCLKVKEGQYPPPAEDSSKPRNLKDAIKIYFRECFTLPYYRWAIIGFVLCRHSVLAVNTYVIFYAKDLGMTMDRFGKLLAMIFLGAFILSFLWGWLADKFHPIRVGICGIGVLMLVQALGGFFITDVTTFIIVYALHETVIMSFNTLTASYPQRIFPKALFA